MTAVLKVDHLVEYLVLATTGLMASYLVEQLDASLVAQLELLMVEAMVVQSVG